MYMMSDATNFNVGAAVNTIDVDYSTNISFDNYQYYLILHCCCYYSIAYYYFLSNVILVMISHHLQK